MGLQGRIVAVAFFAAVGTVYYLEARMLALWVAGKRRKKGQAPKLTGAGPVAQHAVAVLGLLCLGWAYFVEPYRLEVTTVPITTNKLGDTRLRVVQISDLRCDLKARNEPELPGIINALQPDVIVFTGNAVNTPEALSLFRETLGKMKARIGKYAVRGDIDTIADWPRPWELFEGTGFVLMEAGGRILEKDGAKFLVSGLTCEGGQCEGSFMANKEGRFNVFLCHDPQVVQDVQGRGVDLYLSGHTLGGQVALPLYGALIPRSAEAMQYERGLYRVGDVTLYVNRGIGMEGGWRPRIRFWSRPEITVFDIGSAPGGAGSRRQ